MNNILYRPVAKNDVNFILNSMLQGMRDYNATQNINCYNFFDNAKQLILDLLAESDCVIVCDSEETDVIYAYCIFDIKTIHYVYVKHPLRRNGIANNLVAICLHGDAEYYTIQSKMAYLAQKKNLKYNPFYLSTGEHK
jgi:hypothetical protein